MTAREEAAALGEALEIRLRGVPGILEVFPAAGQRAGAVRVAETPEGLDLRARLAVSAEPVADTLRAAADALLDELGALRPGVSLAQLELRATEIRGVEER